MYFQEMTENGINHAELEDDVESFEFMGDGSRIVYLRGVDYNGLRATYLLSKANVPDEVSTSAYYYEVTKDF